MVFLVLGTLFFIQKYSRIEKSLPVNSWRTTSVSTQFYNTTAEVETVSISTGLCVQGNYESDQKQALRKSMFIWLYEQYISD